ncbi:hypothetical protein [Stenotrophomonas phage SB2]|uniref:Uncharacterized protein n=1 Tax=Stenotrophomonas phage SB2 TaxID=3117468 RepID=A0ABZ2GY62_9CAUD
MATKITNRITINVPLRHLDTIKPALDRLTLIAGGVTGTAGYGVWFDANGTRHRDDLVVLTWHFTDEASLSVDSAARMLVDDLFAAGEKSVFKDRFYTGKVAGMLSNVHGFKVAPGHATRIIYPMPLYTKTTNPLGVIADDQSLRHLNS